MIQQSQLKRPHSFYIGQLNSQDCYDQAQWVKQNIPVLQKSNGSGKFYQNYISYGFWHDSSLPLIKNFVSSIRSQANNFEQSFGKQLRVDFVYLSYVEDASQDVCIWHKDGYWWDGQFHLSILGNSNILIKDGEMTIHVSAENGTVWYLNGSEYYHKIANTFKGPRFELLAPCNLRAESVERKLKAVVDKPERWIDGQHPSLIEEVETAVSYMKVAISEGRASNLNVADWPVYGENLIIRSNT